jgi:uncharacterized protein HemY
MLRQATRWNNQNRIQFALAAHAADKRADYATEIPNWEITASPAPSVVTPEM